jgi:hypothetical protein
MAYDLSLLNSVNSILSSSAAYLLMTSRTSLDLPPLLPATGIADRSILTSRGASPKTLLKDPSRSPREPVGARQRPYEVP